MLGHQFKERGDGVHPPSALVFKNLKADWFRGPERGPGAARGVEGGEEEAMLMQDVARDEHNKINLIPLLTRIHIWRKEKGIVREVPMQIHSCLMLQELVHHL